MFMFTSLNKFIQDKTQAYQSCVRNDCKLFRCADKEFLKVYYD